MVYLEAGSWKPFRTFFLILVGFFILFYVESLRQPLVVAFLSSISSPFSPPSTNPSASTLLLVDVDVCADIPHRRRRRFRRIASAILASSLAAQNGRRPSSNNSLNLLQTNPPSIFFKYLIDFSIFASQRNKTWLRLTIAIKPNLFGCQKLNYLS